MTSHLQKPLSPDRTDALRTWIQSPETLSLLEKIAQKIAGCARARRLSPDFIDLGAGLEDPEVPRAVLSALIEFILTRAAFPENLFSARMENRAGFILTSFLNYWKDRSLAEDGDPWRKFRKHVFDTLRGAKPFITCAKPPPSRFTMAESSRTIQSPPTDILKSIPPPDDIRLTRSEAAKGKTILRLAGHFWRRMSETYDHPVWIEISDVASWIFIHTDMGARWEDTDASPLDEDQIADWAGRFAHRLTPVLQEVFRCRICRKMTLKETAARIRVKSPQTVSNHQEHARELLTEFRADLPWLSGEDYDDRAAEFFIERLCAVLEKILSTPSS